MKILKNINDLTKAIDKTSNLGFVPTMGGLHEGHISLIKKSKKKCNKTLVSIYINPTQFNNKKDFKNYPRSIEKDLSILKKLNIDFVFLPDTKEIYANNKKIKVKIKKKDKVLCAKFRKGHFEGVIDIIDRFLFIIKPKYIFLGEKDYQQFFLINKYLQKKYKTNFVLCKTIRDKNFMALSTRNFLLSKKSLKKAGYIAKKLINIKKLIIKKRNTKNITNIIKEDLIKIFNIKIDYLEIRNKKTFEINKVDKDIKLFIAYHINKIRLIDNF